MENIAPFPFLITEVMKIKENKEKEELDVVTPEEPQEQVEATKMNEEPQEQQALDQKPKTEKKPNTKKEAKETKTIPEYVDRLLKSFSNYSALYVDNKGGVYTKDTQPNILDGAILYQNPYYNKQ